MLKKVSALILAAMLAASLTACGGSNPNTNPTANTGSSSAVQSSVAAEASNTSIEGTTFTERDMQQEADTADAKTLNVTSGQNTTITEAGVYIITGTATDTSVIVEAADDAKVQLVLQNLTHHPKGHRQHAHRDRRVHRRRRNQHRRGDICQG